MKRDRTLPRFVSPALFLVVLALAVTGQSAPSPKKSLSDELFNGPIRYIQIEIAAAGIENLRRQPRGYVRGTIREGRQVYPEVAVRLKGSAGSFRPIDHNPNFTLNMDKFVDGQRFYGLDKLHLNNSVQDPSYLREILASEIFLASEIPTPRAVNVHLELNGRPLGIYVLKGGFDKVLLRQHFPKIKGNLYDGGFRTDVNAPLDRNSGSGPADHSDLKALVAAAEEPDPSLRIARLGAVLDVDRFLTFAALEMMLVHWDGYALAANNYRVYCNPEDGRMVFLAHGMDQVFGDPALPLLPRMNSVVARGLLTTPEGEEQYYQRVKALYAEKFDPSKMLARVDQLADRIQNILREKDPARLEEHQGSVRDLKQRIVLRDQSIASQLDAAPNR